VKRIVLLLVLLSLAAASAAAGASDPVRLTFDKSSVSSGIWQGSVAGDVSGGLRTALRSVRVSGPIWHVQFDWIVSAGAHSFVARLDGTLNNDTGAVVMNGTVVGGWLRGAHVHEQGQLVDAATLRFVGAIDVMPASA
jgi:hypothetical protein